MVQEQKQNTALVAYKDCPNDLTTKDGSGIILSYCNITDYFLVAQSFKMLERYWTVNGEDSYVFNPEYDEDEDKDIDEEYYESEDQEYDPTKDLECASFKLSI